MLTFKEPKSTRSSKNLKKKNLKCHNYCQKKVAVTTEEQMDAETAKNQEKRKLKKQAPAAKLLKKH